MTCRYRKAEAEFVSFEEACFTLCCTFMSLYHGFACSPKSCCFSSGKALLCSLYTNICMANEF